MVMKDCVVTSYCQEPNRNYQNTRLGEMNYQEYQIGRDYLWVRWLRLALLLTRSTRAAVGTFPHVLWKQWSIVCMKSHTHCDTHVAMLYVAYVLDRGGYMCIPSVCVYFGASSQSCGHSM